MHRPLLATVLLLAIWPAAAQTQLAQAPPAAAARALGERIGVAGAVRGAVYLTPAAGPSDAVGAVARSGSPVHLGDRVRSGPDAGLQVILLDETVFSIGPDAELTIDRFVFDPATDTGTVAASITKGAFRFITGRVAIKDPQRMSVRLPQATIGVRGTMVAGEVREAENVSEVVLLGPGPENTANDKIGAISVSNAAGSVTIERPGFATIIAMLAPPSPPVALPPDRVRSLSGRSSVSAGPRPPPAPGGAPPRGAGGGGPINTVNGIGVRPPPTLQREGQLPPRPPPPPPLSMITTFQQLAQVPSGTTGFTIAQNPITLNATSGSGSGFFGFSAVVNHANRTLNFQVNANLTVGGMPFNGLVYGETLAYGAGPLPVGATIPDSAALQASIQSTDAGDAPRFAPFFTTAGRNAAINVQVQNNPATGRVFHQGTVTLTVNAGPNTITGTGTGVRP